SAALLRWLDIPRSETPVLVHATNVMRNPSAAQVARSLGLRAEVDGERFDLAVLGGGPAGLAAAVYGGSEGLRTFVAEAWAPGARWRELEADGIERFRGAGVYHAAMAHDAERCRDEDVIVVGGGNSAGQAAVHLATRARSVRVVVRGKGLSSSMSRYLIDRIEASPRLEAVTEMEVAAGHGT